MGFIEIARGKMSDYNEDRICPDQYVGDITVTSNNITLPASNDNDNDFETRENLSTFSRNNPLIILILESPHIDEYAQNTPRPAAGNRINKTGKAIRKMFNYIISSYNDYTIPSGTYSLIIMNAIQYQCSLGKKPSKFRNDVFLECWDDFGKQDFINRFFSIYQNNDIIINACTKGTDRPYTYLRDLVEEEIINLGYNSHIKLQHPCRWRKIYNTAIKNKIPQNYNW